MTTPKPEDVEATVDVQRMVHNAPCFVVGGCAKCRRVAAALLSERVATARACAKAVCVLCFDGQELIPPGPVPPDRERIWARKWRHKMSDTRRLTSCMAADVWRAFPEAIPGKGEE